MKLCIDFTNSWTRKENQLGLIGIIAYIDKEDKTFILLVTILGFLGELQISL